MAETQSIYNYYVSVCVNLLMGNIDTLQAHNNTLSVFTTTNDALTKAWTTGPGDQDIVTALNNVNSESDMANFIQDYLMSSDQAKFSLALVTAVMTKLSSSGVWTTDNGPSQMNVINQFNGLVTSSGTEEEQTGQNEGKTESSVLQQDAGAQQPLSDIGNAVSGIAQSENSLLQQTF
jgi:hypothetical protein